jgi:hypothetical protein
VFLTACALATGYHVDTGDAAIDKLMMLLARFIPYANRAAFTATIV